MTTSQKWKTTSKKIKNGRRPQKKFKIEDDLIYFEKIEWRPQKNGKQPKKKMKNGRRPKKIKNGRQPQKKMEDEPINQNQPNWLWHHCKFT